MTDKIDKIDQIEQLWHHDRTSDLLSLYVLESSQEELKLFLLLDRVAEESGTLWTIGQERPDVIRNATNVIDVLNNPEKGNTLTFFRDYIIRGRNEEEIVYMQCLSCDHSISGSMILTIIKSINGEYYIIGISRDLDQSIDVYIQYMTIMEK